MNEQILQDVSGLLFFFQFILFSAAQQFIFILNLLIILHIPWVGINQMSEIMISQYLEKALSSDWAVFVCFSNKIKRQNIPAKYI